MISLFFISIIDIKKNLKTATIKTEDFLNSVEEFLKE